MPVTTESGEVVTDFLQATRTFVRRSDSVSVFTNKDDMSGWLN